jgi:hypothetical protein
MWTTKEELVWLHGRIPDFLATRETRGKQILHWLRETAAEFVAAFPARGSKSKEYTFEVRNS